MLLREALEPIGIPVAGVMPPLEMLKLPERHLGLVQAGEHAALEAFVATAATVVRDRIDTRFAGGFGHRQSALGWKTTPNCRRLGKRIAVAQDAAFAFAYPHLLQGWRDAWGGDFVFLAAE